MSLQNPPQRSQSQTAAKENRMAYVATNYKTNSAAPVGKWTCAPTSTLAPLDKYPISTSWHAPLVLAPNHVLTSGNNLCGQCVSYVKKVCPNLPSTDHWKKGASVKGNTTIIEGT